MALIDSCILHNKLGSVAEVGASEIGPNGVIGGAPTYHAVKFDNGVLIDTSGEYILFQNLLVGNKGIIEYWFKPSGWSITNGLGTINYCVMFTWYVAGGADYIYLQYWVGNGIWAWNHSAGQENWNFTGVNHDVANGQLVHFMYCYDRDGIGGGANTRRVYIDGVLIDSNNGPLGDISGDGVNNFMLGTHWLATSWVARAYFDNIKIYNTCTESTITDIIANKDNEGWPSVWLPPNKFNRVVGLKAGLPL
jgi:hypothetical protein